MKMHLTLMTSACLLASSAPLLAQDGSSITRIDVTEAAITQTGWQSKTIKLKVTGSAVSKEARGIYRTAEAIYSGDSETAGNVAFTCYAGTLTASVALRPIDMAEMMTNPPSSRRMKNRRPTFTVDGGKRESIRFIYMPALGAYRSSRRSTVAKLYRAALRGSDVTMMSDGETAVLNLPPVNDIFKMFGSECGVGLDARK